MTLNKEDFAILQGNVRQIENYLRSLMPEIVEPFSVGFGGWDTRGTVKGLKANTGSFLGKRRWAA